ncbi:MAG TPA: phosphatidylserine/phosphatidylglycerophosphate/cardiolipin synthase family protein [Bacteroidales bacterium]|nr:phosphatidylserine/phosphatidylglycerophosphate/cardiolipin synthase family protein [Bacteroidales bacterium]
MQSQEKYLLYDDTLKLYLAMLEDINQAKRSVYLQTYIFGNDSIGQRFRQALTEAVRRGVEVKVLIDSWGTAVGQSFFKEFVELGGKLKFFEKIKVSFDVFSRNHRRNHRKLLLIDSNITYIGSANITAYCLSWRECCLRIVSDMLCIVFEKIFSYDYYLSSRFFQNKKYGTKILKGDEMAIVQDVPGTRKQPVKNVFRKLIDSAEKEVVIETPYFLPGSLLKRSLINASKRGVKVTIIVPKNSDVTLFDILRNRYFGTYHKNGVEILEYRPSNLHAKVFLSDNKYFFTGSSNFDYRSFLYMHEINIAGRQPDILRLLTEHIENTKKDCDKFNYEKWKKRHGFQKLVETLLVPFRHLF